MTRRALLLCLLLFSGMATAHPLAPALLELQQTADGRYDVLWRISALQRSRTPPQPVLPTHCQAQGQPEISTGDNLAVTSRWQVACETRDLTGQGLAISGLAASGINVILRLEQLDGSRHQALLDAAQPAFSVPDAQSAGGVFGRYLQLGIEHLLLGPDHLLFLLGLLLLVQGWRRLVLTLTAFTIGHSITLSLAALDLFALPQSLTEVGIAISILLLARELLSQKPSWIGRYPMLMAGVFGLLHGLGFAGVLGEIGLPQTEVASALLGFNLGIELAQLLIVASVLPVTVILKKLRYKKISQARLSARPLPAYVMGALAVMWCIERIGQVEPLQQWMTAI